MRTRTQFLLTVLLVICCVSKVTATNYYVAVTGSTENDGLSESNAWQTIQWAIDRTLDGDVINVSTGVYSEWLPVSNSVTIVGQDLYYPGNVHMERHVSRTIIKPLPSPTFYSSMMEIKGTNVTVQNITFDAESHTNVAFAIYARHRPITVERCTFANIMNGYGICVAETNNAIPSDPVATRSYFNDNFFTNIMNTDAVGIYLQKAPANIAFNEFVDITGDDAFGGITMTKCYLGTNLTTFWMSIDTNYFNNCLMAIWANYAGDDGNEILIRGNVITNCLIGIRVTAAQGPATLSDNTIYVEGVSTSSNATPARGIWIQADENPWDPSGVLVTDHLVTDNTVVDTGTNAGTVGMLFEYGTSTAAGNNGVRATVLNNNIDSFDYGIYLEAGTNNVLNVHHPLVDLDIHNNSIENFDTYGLYLDSVTNQIDAATNWWGSYDPSGAVSGNVDIADALIGDPYSDTDADGTNDVTDIDDDNDGLVDTNELAIGTSPAITDSDNDGQSDYDEYVVTGLDPLDSSSFFAASVPSSSTGIYNVVKWPSVTGRLYSVYRTVDITGGFDPSPITNGIIADPPMNTYTDFTAVGSSPYFYRVVVTNALP